jgi:hypothetical protein
MTIYLKEEEVGALLEMPMALTALAPNQKPAA